MAGSKGSKYYNIFLRYNIWLAGYNDNIIINPELFDILQHVNNEGSIVDAAAKLNISFRKAWNMIKKSEEMLGFKLVEKKRGGVNGGYSVLSEDGCKLLMAHNELVDAFDISIHDITKKFFSKINQ